MKSKTAMLVMMFVSMSATCWSSEVAVKAYVDVPGAKCLAEKYSGSKTLKTFQKGTRVQVANVNPSDRYVKLDCGGTAGFMKKQDLYLFRPGQTPKGWDSIKSEKAPVPANKPVASKPPVDGSTAVAITPAENKTSIEPGQPDVEAVVKMNTVMVRSTLNTEKAIGSLSKGTKLKVLRASTSKKWVTVRFKEGLGVVRKWTLDFSKTPRLAESVVDAATSNHDSSPQVPSSVAVAPLVPRAVAAGTVQKEAKQTLRKISIEIQHVETKAEVDLRQQVERLKAEMAALAKDAQALKSKSDELSRLESEIKTKDAEIVKLQTVLNEHKVKVEKLLADMSSKDNLIAKLQALTPAATVIATADKGEDIFLNGVGKATLARKGDTVIFRVAPTDTQRADKLLGMIAKEKYSQNGFGYYVVDAQAVNL